MMVSLDQQIDEVRRELEQRARVYPRMVMRGKMRQSIADYQTQRMLAVLHTLERVKASDDLKMRMYQQMVVKDGY